MSQYRLEVRVKPRPGLLDPEGKAIHHALNSLGWDGVDELSVCDASHVAEVNGSDIVSYDVTPEALDLDRCDASELQGGTPAENADILLAILEGEEQGARRQAVVLNAAAAIAARVTPIASST